MSEEIKEVAEVSTKIEDGKFIVETKISVTARIAEINEKFIILDEQEVDLNSKLAAISNTRQILNDELLLLK